MPPASISAPAPPPNTAPPGFAARRIAADIVGGVLRQRRSLDELLETSGLDELPERDRALVRAIVAMVLRRLGTLRYLLGGLLERLSEEELAGVLAHELAHVKNRDTLIMTITATIAGAISMLAQFGMFFGGNRDNNNGGTGLLGTLAMVILAPIAAMLVQMAISRTREYAADDMGARIAGRPEWLAAALAKLDAAAHAIPNDDAERNPATAHLFIVNPLSGQRMDNLFSTHPATENRIAALQQLASEMNQGGITAPRTARHVPAGPWNRRPAGPWG